MYMQEKGMRSKKMIVIIDLHCDASLPLGTFDAGGGNKYSRNLILLLISRNIPVLYFTARKSEELEANLQITHNCHFFRIKVDVSNYNDIDYSIENKQRVIDYVDSILNNYKDCSFIFHSIYWISGEIAEYFSIKYKTYFIHTVVSNGMSKKLQCEGNNIIDKRCKIEKQIYDQARYIICSSTTEAEDINKYYNIPAEKIVVSGRWIEKEYIYPYRDLEGNPRTFQFSDNFPVHYIAADTEYLSENISEEWWHLKAFLYVGRIHVNKGITQIIAAWERLYKKLNTLTPPLWIVGGTPYEISTFKNQFLSNDSLVVTAERTHKLVWWGSLAAEGISTLMMKSLVLVMHSKYEAGGNVLLEAMAHALPVIATPFGYAKDHIRHSENGYLVDYDDVEALSRYMEFFSNQPYLSNYMGRVAANDMTNFITESKFIEKHFYVYGISNNYHSKESMKKAIPRDSINTFSQKFELPDEQYIYYLITKNTEFKVLDISCIGNVDNYYLWEIVTNTKTIYFYFLYSILNRKCLKEKRNDYFISKSQRVTFLQKESENNKNTIYYSNTSEGYILLERKARVYL